MWWLFIYLSYVKAGLQICAEKAVYIGEERRGKFMTYPRTYILSLIKTIKGPIASLADSVIMCKCEVYACIQSGGIECGTMDQSGHIYSTGEYLLAVFMHFRTCFRTQLE